MMTASAHSAGYEACEPHLYRPFFPFRTLKCLGRPLFRSRAARDYACLLDLDDDVVSWRCVTSPIVDDDGSGPTLQHFIDFEVDLGDDKVFIDIVEAGFEQPPWISRAAGRHGCRYQCVQAAEFQELPRLQNARDLMRYAGWEAALGDRIRILMALEDLGSLTLGECLAAIRDGKPMQSMAAMILKGVVSVDLHEGLLGPETIVRPASR